MIGSIDIKVNAARPNLPLAPLFAFQDSPSSLRVMDVPKSIGNWSITSVKVVATYPDNITIEKIAVRSGSVWVATFEGSESAGKVSNGYEVIADGKDEDGNDVSGYVLGKGDVFILENGTDISRLVDKIAVRYLEEIPDVPAKGDLMNSNGELRLFDGEDWIVISTTEPPPVYDSQITIKKNGTPVGTFTVNADQPKAIDIPVPSRTTDIENDSGFITVEAIPSTISSFDNDVGYITASALPTKVSELENDVGYVTEEAIPSNVTAFNNDAGYITAEAIPSDISSFNNDVGYVTATAIPSQVSSFENDVGYITASALPTKVSELENDSGYITESTIPSNVGAFQNDVGYLTSVSWGEVQDKPDVALMSDIPSKVSELENDSGFITLAQVPTPSYIEDATGNRINANLSSIYIDNAWEVTDPSSNKYVLEYVGFIQSYHTWEYVVPENIKLVLTYANDWELQVYTWQEVELEVYDWVRVILGVYNGDSDITTIPYFVNGTTTYNYSAQRPITKHLTLATKDEIPTKTSDLVNDSGFITASQVPPVPSNLSEYNNDVGFITASAIPSNVTAFNNDAGYITANALPTKVSELQNDVGYITASQVPPIPSNLSDYNNDVGFITASAIPSNVSQLNNDSGYLTASSSAFVAKRDKTDMSAVVGTTYASWNLSELHTNTYSPALELKWGTYNVFGQEQECWLGDDEYRQLCFFLMPELTQLFWGVKNQDGSYIAGYGESITLSSDELSIATINGVAEITCTRTSKEGSPEVSTIATMKDIQGLENISELRNWWDNTCPASIDTSGRYTINTFSAVIGSNSYFLDQFSKSGSTSTWKGSGNYPTIATTDGLNFVLNTDSSTTGYFTIGELKPGPAKGTIGGSNFNVYANFKLTTYAMKDYVDDQIGNVLNEQF